VKIEYSLQELEYSVNSSIKSENTFKSSKLKRLIDITISLLIMPFIIPVILIIALLVKIDSRGNIFFVQERLGKDFKTFKCFKFRTMYSNSEQIFKDYLLSNPDAFREWNEYKKLKDDPRITKIGKFLRKTSLDELPQILNVIKGEMSLVGPRPYLPSEEKDMQPYSNIILSVKPGVTGLWQVSGRNKLSFKQRLHLDSIYALNNNLITDLVILIRTIKVVFLGEGAY
jgi:undecaprenyl-phosphate galactose phosphotransferase